MLIRADAGPTIGTGHVMRCLALAQAWLAGGGRSTLLGYCPAELLQRRIRAAGVDFQPLEHRHPKAGDLTATLDWLRRIGSEADPAAPAWLVLDGYHFDAAYQQAIRQTGCRLLVIDDMARLPRYYADLLLNQNLAAERLSYTCDEETTVMLGSRYALVRPEFLSCRPRRRRTPEMARRLLVTMGGADPENVTPQVVRALERLDLPGMEGKVLVGAANPRLESLRAAIERSGADLELLTNVEDMPRLMAWADVAVAAAGITCWEMALMGLPAAVLVVAENQLRIAEPLAEAGAVVNLGWHDRLTPDGIAAEVASLCRDQGRRRAQSEAGRRLFDGRGAERVVAVMRTLDGPLPEDQLRLRPVAPEDMLPLWRLVNQPTVRRNSLNSDPIPLDEHVRWFNQKLSSPDTCIWVLDFHGLVLAPIRYDRIDAETAQISLHVAAPFRRRGLATRLLNLTWQDACRRLKVNRLRAVIKQDNTASERTFLKAGFRRIDSPVPSGLACHVLEKRA